MARNRHGDADSSGERQPFARQLDDRAERADLVHRDDERRQRRRADRPPRGVDGRSARRRQPVGDEWPEYRRHRRGLRNGGAEGDERSQLDDGHDYRHRRGGRHRQPSARPAPRSRRTRARRFRRRFWTRPASGSRGAPSPGAFREATPPRSRPRAARRRPGRTAWRRRPRRENHPDHRHSENYRDGRRQVWIQ